MNKKLSLYGAAFYAALGVLALAIGVDMYLLYLNAFDFPYYDEWELLPIGSLDNVFRVFNENMQVFYELASEFMFYFFGWNLRYFCFLSFGVYLFMVGVYFYLVRAQMARQLRWWVPLCFVALFTPILSYNWLWPLLIQTHTYVLFFLLAVYFGFCKDDKWQHLVWFVFFLICSVAAMNVPLALATIGIFVAKELVNMKGLKRYNRWRIMLPVVFFAVAEGCFFWPKFGETFHKSQFVNVFSLMYLEQLSFYVWNSLSLFWLAKVFSGWWYVGLFLIHIVLLGIAFGEQYRIKERQGLWAVVGAVMFNLCTVVAFRHGEVYEYGWTFIRHNEVAFVMIPATICVFLLSQKKFLRIYGGVLLMLMLAGYAADMKNIRRFSFFSELLYKNMCQCMNYYYNIRALDEWECRNSFYIPVDRQLRDARRKHLHFVQTMRRCY